MRKLLPILLFIIFLSWSIFFAPSPAVEAQAAPSCYQTTQAGEVEKLPTCDNAALSQSGFVTDGMPNPLTGCYMWTTDITKPGTEIACDDPKVTSAPSFGSTSTTPPPADLDNASGQNGDGFIETECVESNNYSSCGIIQTVYKMINFFSVGVGIIVVMSVILGGVQYITAGNNPQVVSKAKGRVYNAILALVIYIVMFSFIQWLVPGGLFN